jgi:hypothetical protein
LSDDADSFFDAVALVVLCLGFQHIHHTIVKFAFAALYQIRIYQFAFAAFVRVIGFVYSHVGRFLNYARTQLQYSTVGRIAVGSAATVWHSVQ